MTTSAIRIAILAAFAVLFSVTSTRAKDTPDCGAALKAALADKTDGKLAKALTELATCSQPTCTKATQKRCTDLTQTVTELQPTIVFSAKDAGGNAVTTVTVTVDGAVVTSNLDGIAVPMDPGNHTMKFEMVGATTVEKQVAVDPGVKGQKVAVDLDIKPTAPPPAAAAAAAVPVSGDAPGSMTDVTEDPTKRYYFIGLRYRGDIIPQFMLNMFVNGGETLYSNSVGIEADLRHDGFSLIPALTYTEYSTGDIVFSQKGKDPTDAGNWSLVNSSLKAIYASADLLWTVHVANHWDFEYGAEFGLGIVFGSLEDNWVFPTSGGQVSPTNYTACQTTTQAFGCSPADHQNATVNKVGGYMEPSWVNGGSKPNLFPLVNFPQVGFRYKPIKQVEARFGLGFSITGFWFGLSADYGLENPTK